MNDADIQEAKRPWPRPVQLFALSYLLSTAFSALNSFLQSDSIRQRLIESTHVASPPESWVILFIALRSLISLAILTWAVRRHSLIARLLIGVQFAGWVYGMPKAIGLIARSNFAAVPFVLAGLFSAVAVACLLTPAARQWFSNKGSTHADDVDRFS